MAGSGGCIIVAVMASGGEVAEVLAGEHGDDSVELAGGAHVEVGDAGAGEVRPQERGVQHARQHHVVDVLPPAGDEPAVLPPGDPLADEAPDAGAGPVVGRGGEVLVLGAHVVPVALAHWSAPRIDAAACCTALMIPW